MAAKTQRRNIQKSVLMTPDPYHVPGYGGFCPQFTYQIGETFGRTTCRLLDNKAVASSRKLVLAEINPDADKTAKIRQDRVQTIRTRTGGLGDQKLVERMVPGYTGFIPKSQHFFGKRYAENCVSAIADFEENQRQHGHKMWELKTIDGLQSGREVDPAGKSISIRTNQQTPLQPIAKVAKPYILKNSPQHTRSPYYMDNTNPDKNFMSGYTGFVPRCRGLIGSGYPIITRTALNEFTDDTKRLKALASQPVSIHRQEAPRMSTKPVYTVDSGLVPHYTGHIPGEKFSYGDTFGHSTKNALAKMRVPAAAAAN